MSVRNGRAWCLAAIAASAISACSGKSDPTPPNPPNPPDPPDTNASLRLTNNYAFSIVDLRIAPASSPDWGANQLTASVPPGASFTVTGIPAGTYDLRAVASDGAVAEQRGVGLSGGVTRTWTVTAPAPTTGSVRLVNNYAFPVTELYVAPMSAPTWGPDFVAGSVPTGGGTFTVTDVPPGSYKLRAVASNAAFAEQFNVSVTAGNTYVWTVDEAPAASLTVVNGSGFSVTELYVSPSTSGTWGPDQLAGTISPGGSFTLTGIPPGTWDFKAVSAGGTVFWTRFGTGLASGITFTWTLL
jgi:hypothetical protein